MLIICGSTGVGKTQFGTQIAKLFNGEIISADSRQVYCGMDIVTGKDLSYGAKRHTSYIKWQDKDLSYYELDNNSKIWLYDVISPDEPFNVSFWKDCADILIKDIHSRGKLPIIVGGTGLYIRSITDPLTQIKIPPSKTLRDKLAKKTPSSLLKYLSRINPEKAASLNISDRHNPRRLIRSIEITLYQDKLPEKKFPEYDLFSIGLTAPLPELLSRIDRRVLDRVSQGAEMEVKKLVELNLSWQLPSMSASGYKAWQSYPENRNLAGVISRWQIEEHQYVKRQLLWFKKYPPQTWFDITISKWQSQAVDQIKFWYNNDAN